MERYSVRCVRSGVGRCVLGAGLCLHYVLVCSVGAQTGDINLGDDEYLYEHDAGEAFGEREGGLRYGWAEAARTGEAADPAVPLGRRHETYAVLSEGNPWEVEVPNGRYRVRVTAGDGETLDAVYRVDAEGVRVVDGEPRARFPWVTGEAVVEVTDGRLTLTAGEGARNVRLATVDITSPMYGSDEEPTFAKLPLRINAGGGVVSSAGGDYVADKKWVDENQDYGWSTTERGGAWRYDSLGEKTYCGHPSVLFVRLPRGQEIAGTEDDAVYRDVLANAPPHKKTTHDNLSYKVRVPEGRYRVTLLFTHWQREDRPSRARFGVEVEGVAQDVWPIRDAGGENFQATRAVFDNVEVRDGMLDIAWHNRGDSAEVGNYVCGIEVEAVGAEGDAGEAVGEEAAATAPVNDREGASSGTISSP